MIKSIHKVGPTVVYVLLTIIGAGIYMFALLFLKIILEDFKFIGLVIVVLFLLLSSVFLYFSFTTFNRYEVDIAHKILVVKVLMIWKQEVPFAKIRGCRKHNLVNKLGEYPGLLIELENNRQFLISEFDLENFSEISQPLLRSLPYRNELMQKVAPIFKRIFICLCTLLILLLIIGKLFKLA